MSFDPYAAWLQVPDDRRPPNHYDLLGLPTLEADVERIRAAAMERIALVRKYQLGQHADDSIRLLGELSRAFDCLTDTDRKRAYDRQLGGQQTVAPPPSRTVADVPLPPPRAELPPVRPLEPPPLQPRQSALRPVVWSVPSSAPVPPPIVNPVGAKAFPAATAIASASPMPRRHGAGRRKSSSAMVVGIAFVAVVLAGGIAWVASRTAAPKIARAPTATKSKDLDVSLPVEPPPLSTSPEVDPPTATPTATVPPGPTPLASESTPATPVANLPTPAGQPVELPPAATPVATIQPPPITNPPPVATTVPPVGPLKLGPKTDLLKLINPNRDALKGSWTVDDVRGNLHAPANVAFAALELPIDPPEEYVLSVSSVRRGATPDTLVFGLVMQQSPFVVVVDGNGKVGLESVDGRPFDNNATTHPGGVYPVGTRTDFACTVLKSRVTVQVNGKQIIDWQGPAESLQLSKDWPVRRRQRLFLGSHSNHMIVKAELTSLKAAATSPAIASTPPAAEPPIKGAKIDVLKLIDVNRDAIRGGWKIDSKGDLQSPRRDDLAVLELPIDPPEEYILSITAVRYPYTQPGALIIGLVMQRTPFAVVIDAGNKAGLEMVDGRMFHENETTHPGSVYPNQTTTTFVCTVRKSHVTMTSLRKPVIDWQGNPSRLKLFSAWQIRNRQRLFIGTRGNHRILSVNLTPLNASVPLASSNQPAATVGPPNASPDAGESLALREKTLLESLAAAGTAPPPSLAESMLDLVDSAVEAEQFDMAARVAGNVPQVADDLKELTARKELRVRINEARKARASWEALAAAKSRLAEQPDDPAANTTYGRYLCLVAGDWSLGLPRLTKSDDAKLAALALDDLANPPDAKARLDLADRWWEQATSAVVAEKPPFKTRAGHWYEKVLPGLTGLQKSRVEARLAQAAPAKAGSPAPAR